MKQYYNQFRFVLLRCLLIFLVFQILFFNESFINKSSLIHLLMISGIFSLTYGVAYPYLWNESTFTAWINVIISVILNLISGLIILFIIWPKYFYQLLQTPTWILLLIFITTIIHIIIFYGINYWQNHKASQKLNLFIKTNRS